MIYPVQLPIRQLRPVNAMQILILIQQFRYKVSKSMANNTSKRGWTAQEDQIIVEMMAQDPQERFKWIEVSRALEEKTGRVRTGKQCRQRWQHQLNPAIVRDQWTQNQQATLFSVQTQVGNKWAQIAAFLPGRTDNAVKNYFYSSVRRVLTKLNLYLAKQKVRKQFKIIRQFEADYLSKLMAVVDGHFDKRVRLTGPQIIQLAKDILAEIAKLVSIENHLSVEEADERLDSLIIMMQDFRKNCKKRKQATLFQEGGMRYADSASVEEESSSFKDSSSQSNSSASKSKKAKPRCRSTSIQNFIGMDIEECPEVSNLAISTKLSTKSMEEENLAKGIGLKSYDNIFEAPRLFKGFSDLIREEEPPKEDSFFDLFSNEQSFKKFGRMEDEMSQWHGVGMEESDIFSLSQNQREDFLGESRAYGSFGSTQVVTKFKMLEASIALDQCLLKAKQSSHLEKKYYQ